MSAAFTEDQARAYMHKLLATMSQAGGSDLFVSADFPPSMKSQGAMKPLTAQKLAPEVTRMLAHSLMNETQRAEFAKEMECNFAISIPGVSRFRVNVFVQQRCVGMVIRTIASEIPNFEKLKLPPVLKDVVMTKRGLVLVVGATGSGKSTTLAAMIDHRNRTSPGHIITVEDPVEYVHPSQLSLVTHREVGIDTHSWHHALKNTLRQAPDVILVGEIRDAETMEHAIAFAETGHLCLGDAARQQRQPDDRADHQLLLGRPEEAAADGPLGQPARDRLAAAGPARGRPGPLGGDRDPAQHADPRREDLQRRFPRDQDHHVALARARHVHLRRGACSTSTTPG